MQLTTTTGNLAVESTFAGLITFRVKPVIVGQALGNPHNERSYSLRSQGPVKTLAKLRKNCNTCGSNPSGGTKLEACCGQLGPYEVTLNVPLYGSLGSARLKRLLPVLN
jgi:hypothetical protein